MLKHYDRNCASKNRTDIIDFKPGDHIQYMADNDDHNIRTLDGCDTFHEINIFGIVTPGKKIRRQIPRILISTQDILSVGKIDITHISHHPAGLNFLVYEELSLHKYQDSIGNTMDTFWNISLHLMTLRPSWSGMMLTVYKGNHSGAASVAFLSMIDHGSTNISSIYTTLCFIFDHAKHYNITPMITFD